MIFKTITAVINSETIELTKEELFKSRVTDSFLKRFSPTVQDRLKEMLIDHPLSELMNNQEKAVQYARQYNISPAMVLGYLNSTFEEPQDMPEKFDKIMKSLKSLFTDKVLYLPTYRRIEQDLGSIFPELASSSDLTRAMDRGQRRVRSSDYIELGANHK
jgi:hypothetical protein